MPYSHSPFTPEAVQSLDYKTPYFLFSPQVLTDTVDTYHKGLPGAEIYYAIKSNAEPEVLEVMNAAGCGFEAASSYELDLLKKIGVKPEKIIFGTSIKPAEHIKAFADYGVDRFAIDSEQEIAKIAAIVPGARVYARALVDDSDSVFTMSAKFGVEPQAAAELLIKARDQGLKPYGLSFNVGSQARDPKAWANAITTLIPVIADLEKRGLKLEVLNLGGGYPHHYLDDDGIVTPAEILAHIREALPKLPYEMKIFIEPGRALVASSMSLVVSVFAKIQRSSGYWLYVDGGSYNALLETMAYQGSIRYQMTPLLQDSSGADKEHFIVTGPTGDSLDVIDNDALLPASIDAGDKIIVHDTGAYSLVLTTPFNGFPKPPVYKLGS